MVLVTTDAAVVMGGDVLLALAVEVLVEAMVQEENLGVVHFAMDLAAKGVILVMVVEE